VGRSPATAAAEDLRRFRVEQREAGVPVPTMNGIVSALRFFFTQTLDRPDLARRLVRVTHPRKLTGRQTFPALAGTVDASAMAPIRNATTDYAFEAISGCWFEGG
jgi:hypothetical protein